MHFSEIIKPQFENKQLTTTTTTTTTNAMYIPLYFTVF